MSKNRQDYIRYLNDDRIEDFFAIPALSKLLNIIKNDKEQRFQLEVRQNYVTVYYNGGKLTNIKKGLNGVYTTDFDRNYCKNQGADSIHIQDIEAIGNRDIEKFVDRLDIYIAEMDAWFTKHPKAERANQQIICKKFRRSNEIMNLLDIEFVLGSARFDMLGVDNNGDIKLIELKVGNNALSSDPKSGTGKLNSGVYKHYLDFLHVKQNEKLAKAVVASAENIIKVRKALGLPTYNGKLNLDIASIRFEIWLADYSPRGKILEREVKKMEEIGDCGDIIKINPPFLSEIKKGYEHGASLFSKNRKTENAATLVYNVLRGKDKIGENLIEIFFGDTNILVELGKALDGGDELSDLEKQTIETHYNAVVVSHYHADHAGLVEYKTDCPVYIGSGAYRIVKAMCEYRGKKFANNITTYENGKPFTVGGIKITPYLCDHSAFDSYMLLFEAGGKSILYTGDFRFHGRKDKINLLSRLPKKVDTLICEGTNIGNEKPCFSEIELENQLVEILRNNKKPIFVLQSGSNIDRLVSVYRAAKRSNRIFYEDNYVALIASAAGGKIPRPDVFGDVYAFTPRALCGKRKDMFFEFENKRGLRQIPKSKNFVMLVRPSMLDYVKKLAERMDLSGAVLVYSMWSGYKQNADTAKFLDEVGSLGINIIDLHTSGHAASEDIELLKKTVYADAYITVHTDTNKM